MPSHRRRTNSASSVRLLPYSSRPVPSTQQTRSISRSLRRSSHPDIVDKRIFANVHWWHVEANQQEIHRLMVEEPLGLAAPNLGLDDGDPDQENHNPLPQPRLLNGPPTRNANLDATLRWHNLSGGSLDVVHTHDIPNDGFTDWSEGVNVNLRNHQEVRLLSLLCVSHEHMDGIQC